jgi:hypothetical protein
MVYSSIIRMCITTTVSKLLIVAVASPMAFEILVLVALYWNTLDRPRAADIPMRKVLTRDGSSFFGVRCDYA